MKVEWPSVASVVPQKPPMVLLDEIVDHDDVWTRCRVRIRPGIPCAESDGSVPIAVTLEYMAQCAAVRSGLRRRARGNGPPREGFLIGTRRLVFHWPRLANGEVLDVRVRELWDDGELSSFQCEVAREGSGELAAECILNAFIPADPVHVDPSSA